ncbi:hypothetical protein F4703DRAFT_1795929 [Phycomyces blakesleeanus]
MYDVFHGNESGPRPTLQKLETECIGKDLIQTLSAISTYNDTYNISFHCSYLSHLSLYSQLAECQISKLPRLLLSPFGKDTENHVGYFRYKGARPKVKHNQECEFIGFSLVAKESSAKIRLMKVVKTHLERSTIKFVRSHNTGLYYFQFACVPTVIFVFLMYLGLLHFCTFALLHFSNYSHVLSLSLYVHV